MASAAMPPIALTVADAARRLSIGKTTCYALINEGELDAFHIGRKRLVTAASVEALLEERCARVRAAVYDLDLDTDLDHEDLD